MLLVGAAGCQQWGGTSVSPGEESSANSAEVISPVKPMPARVDTENEGLMLRTGPSEKDGVLAKMLPDDVVAVDSCKIGTPRRRWCRVTYGGITGWAYDQYLALGEPEEDTESALEQAFARAEPINRPAYLDGSQVAALRVHERPYKEDGSREALHPSARIRILRCLEHGDGLGGGEPITGRWCFITARENQRSLSGWVSDAALTW